MECMEPRHARLQAPLSVDCGHSAMSMKTPPGVLKSPVTPHPHFPGLKEGGALQAESTLDSSALVFWF